MFSQDLKSKITKRLAMAPPILWLVWFLCIPLGFVFFMAFFKQTSYGKFTQEITLDHFLRLGDPLYLGVSLTSIKFAALNALICLAAGFPIAYTMALTQGNRRYILQLLVILPFLTNFIIRTEASRIFLSIDGPINNFLFFSGWLQTPMSFLNTQGAVWFGMVTNYLPLMVFPLFLSLDAFDYELLQAARELGARRIQAFFYILLPSIRGGLATGLTLVFVPSLGEFIIPQILGGGRIVLLGGLITEQFLKYRNWPFGAALSAVLAFVSLVGLLFLGKIMNPKENISHEPSRRRESKW